MPILRSSFESGYSSSDSKEYDRDEIEDFVDDHSYDEDAINEFKKVNKLSSFFDKITVGGVVVATVSLMALILIPVYSFVAEMALLFFNPPSLIEGYIDSSPVIQTSTLIIVVIIGGTSALISFTSAKASTKLEKHGTSTGINSTSLNHYRIAQAYTEFDNENYKKGLGYLNNYDGGYKYMVKKYVKAIKIEGSIDEEYIERTYEDFLGITVERLTTSIGSASLYKTIVDRDDSDYYVDESEVPKKKEHTDSYIGIIVNAFLGSVTDATKWISTIIIDRPIVPYGVFLAIGVGLVKISPTLAVVVVTVLTGGFETWRRHKISSNMNQETIKNQNKGEKSGRF